MPYANTIKLGQLVAVARDLKGWTLRDLERHSGVSNPLISQIETGKIKDPGFATVVRLADALGIKVERLAACVRPPAIARAADPKPKARFTSEQSR